MLVNVYVSLSLEAERRAVLLCYLPDSRIKKLNTINALLRCRLVLITIRGTLIFFIYIFSYYVYRNLFFFFLYLYLSSAIINVYRIALSLSHAHSLSLSVSLSLNAKLTELTFRNRRRKKKQPLTFPDLEIRLDANFINSRKFQFPSRSFRVGLN